MNENAGVPKRERDTVHTQQRNGEENKEKKITREIERERGKK